MNKYQAETIKIIKASWVEAVAKRKKIAWQDFRLVLIGAAALLVLVALGEQLAALQPLRIILGLAYTLFVPGYCLTTALFPKVGDLDSIERIGLSIGLSIALVSFVALVLDRLPWGLYLWPILLGEYSMTMLFTGVALRRRSQLAEGMAFAPAQAWQPGLWWKSLSTSERRLYQIVALVLLLISEIAVLAFLVPSSDQFMTEFYILGPDGWAEGYPYQVAPGDKATVTTGVVNQEKSAYTYRFEVWVIDNSHPERRKLVMPSEAFLLRPGEKYERSASWRMPWIGDDQKVEILLFSNNDPIPSHQLQMWINVREEH